MQPSNKWINFCTDVGIELSLFADTPGVHTHTHRTGPAQPNSSRPMLMWSYAPITPILIPQVHVPY